MERIKRSVYSLAFALLLVVSFAMSPGTAHATSAHDDKYQTTNGLSVTYRQGPNTSYRCDEETYVDGDWASYITDESKWPDNPPTLYSSIKASFQAALGSGRLGVSQITDQGSESTQIIKQIIVYWTEDDSLILAWDWDQTNIFAYSPTGNFSYAVIGCTKQSSGWGTKTTGVVGGVVNDSVAAQVSNNVQTLTNHSQMVQNLFVYTDYPNYPTGYEGNPVVSEFVPIVRYVAMGDSFSSGESISPFESGTDVGGVNGCHRSPRAYPRLLQGNLNLGPTAFVACSGATTASIVGGQWNEPAQLDALTDETEIVTLTIGGNDVGFVDYALACNVACGPGSGPYNTIMGKINDPDFKADLVATYEAILNVNEDLDLYVADYPYLAAENATMCQGLDFSGAYDVQEALSGVIHDAVIEVGLNSNHIFMVETNYSGSPFEGGHLCNGGTSLFHGVVPDPWNVEYSLHPNVAGQAAYAEVFEEYIG